MSLRPRYVLPALAVIVCAAPAFAHDFVRDSIPQKWIEHLLPEDAPEPQYRAYHTDLDKAALQAFAGQYRRSLLTLAKIKDPKPEQLVQIALVKSRSLGATGRWDEALKAVSDPALADQPDVQVRRAEALSEMGKPGEALALLRSHLEGNRDSIAGHYALGAVSEKRGDLESAKAAYGWFVAEPQKYLEKWKTGVKDPAFETAQSVTTIGRALDRWAQLNGAYRDNVELHRTLLNVYVKAYDVIDRGYWPARVASAEYFMSHDQRKGAVDELKAALKANPNDAHAWKLMALIALESFNFDGADKAIASIRKVDRNSLSADLLEARNLLLQRRPKDAEHPVRKVLSAQPDHLEAMGLLAAVYALQLQDDKTNEVLAGVDKLDPDNATAYFEVAEQLGALRQYPRAADKYKEAIRRAPWWTAARNGLGLLYTQSGDEIEAREVIEEARKLDPFNLATTNYLQLLDDMDKFARKETEHFILMYDAEQDPLIPEYFADYLESIHAEVCSEFRHEPAVKTMIEVFPTHEAFSVRTTGSPWIGTVGASTGRVIALVSPRTGENTMGTFNWAQVLRHEYTHTVTLSATDNRIAHWMTEGLAVLEERAPLRWDWVPMLYHAVKKKELFSLEDLTWAFVRPKRPIDRTLAYAQSHWVCKYIQETYGHEALLKMLDEFRRAGRQEDVFPKITGKTVPQFTEEFLAWTEKQVASWGYDEETSKKYAELRNKAEALTKAKQYDEAVQAWEQIEKLRPADALPHQRLAGLFLIQKKVPEAVRHLDALHQVELKDNRYAKRIARLYRDTNELDKAAQYGLQAVYVDPYDLGAHELLAEIYEKSGNEAGLARERRVIPVLTEWVEAQKRARMLRPPTDN